MGVRNVVLALAALGLAYTPLSAAQEIQEETRALPMNPGGGGFLGLRIRDVSKDDVSALKLPAERGVVVRDVDRESPAGRAGLKDNDVIVKFQGQAVGGAAQFQRLVSETPPGRAVTIDILRSGTPQTVTATVAEGGFFFHRRFFLEGAPEPPAPPDAPVLPEMPRTPLGDWVRPFIGAPPPHKLGIRFEEISGQLAKYFHLEANEGILVVDVDADGPAGKAGLKAGDVILKVNGKGVASSSDFVQAVRHLEDGSTAPLSVLREGRPLDLHVSLAPAKDRHLHEGPSI
jgi:serine protease Do